MEVAGENFELRKTCNKLINYLRSAGTGGNVFKLSVDIQLPERLQGMPGDFFSLLQGLCEHLGKVFVNGVIQIEILLNSLSANTANLLVKIEGQGPWSLSGAAFDDAEAVIRKTGVKVKKSVRNDFIRFEFFYSFQSLESNSLAGLPFENRRVLIAEDNEVNAMVFSAFVEEWGCISMVVPNGAEAVERAAESVFDVILMDLYMPVRGGVQAIKEIRSFSAVPIVALTASTEPGDSRTAMDAGANDCLLKPLNRTHLFHVLSKYLRRG